MTPNDPELRIPPTRVAKIWGVHPATVRRWIHKGKLPALKTPGRYFRILLADAERLKRSCETVRRVRKRPDAAQIAERDARAVAEIERMA